MPKLFVGGFPRDLEDDELREIFEEYGAVSEAKIIRDKRTGVSRRFGFVVMDNDQEAQQAIELLHGGSIDDEEISVKEAVVVEKPEPPRKAALARASGQRKRISNSGSPGRPNRRKV